jgi:hypothetical protein
MARRSGLPLRPLRCDGRLLDPRFFGDTPQAYLAGPSP